MQETISYHQGFTASAFRAVTGGKHISAKTVFESNNISSETKQKKKNKNKTQNSTFVPLWAQKMRLQYAQQTVLGTVQRVSGCTASTLKAGPSTQPNCCRNVCLWWKTRMKGRHGNGLWAAQKHVHTVTRCSHSLRWLPAYANVTRASQSDCQCGLNFAILLKYNRCSLSSVGNKEASQKRYKFD